MCGIVGFVNFDSVAEQDRKKWIHNALLVDQLRGIDSTGLACLPKKYGTDKASPELRTYKKALAANDFLQLEGCNSILSDAAACKFIMGHNRFATQGDKNSDNFAHPFTYGEVTAIHNGTLHNRNGLNHTHVVDSAAITMELADLAPDKYTKLLSKLNGAYTLVWHNAANNHVYFARNDRRPLFMAKGYKGETLFFASEEWMITWLMDRIDVKALDLDDKGKVRCWSMATEILTSIDLNSPDYNFTEEQYEGYVAPAVPNNTTHTQAYGSEWSNWNEAAYDNLPQTRKSGVAIDLTAADNTTTICPYKVGEVLFAESWSYITHDNGKKKGGKIEGVSVDFPDVQFVVPNVTKNKYQKLHVEWEDWKDAIKDAEDASTMEAMDVEEIFLCGEVTMVSRFKGQSKWIVNIKPKTVKIEFIVTPYDDAYEDIEEDIPLEKKIGARTSTSAKVTGSNDASKSWSIGTRKVGMDEWLGAVGGGCGYCTHEIYMKDHDKIVWKSYIEHGKEQLVPICESCSDFLFSGDKEDK